MTAKPTDPPQDYGSCLRAVDRAMVVVLVLLLQGFLRCRIWLTMLRHAVTSNVVVCCQILCLVGRVLVLVLSIVDMVRKKRRVEIDCVGLVGFGPIGWVN